jgi:recombination protein RecT
MSSTALAPNNQKLQTIKQFFEASAPSFAAVLPKHLTVERVMKIALTAAGRTPALLQCTPASLAQSVMVAAQLGLEAGGALGEAYLVPYGNTCTLIPGYRGLIALARRSGQIVSIEARVVHKGDAFSVRYGLDVAIDHEPDVDRVPKDDDVRAVYAVAKLVGGGVQVEVMTKAEVDAIRKRSKAGSSGPWVTDYEEMARKTVIRRLAKYLPLSVEFANALVLQGQSEAGGAADYSQLSDVILPEVGDIDAADVREAEAPKTEQVRDRVKAAQAAAKKSVPDSKPEADAPRASLDDQHRIDAAYVKADLSDAEWGTFLARLGYPETAQLRDIRASDVANAIALIGAIAAERANS